LSIPFILDTFQHTPNSDGTFSTVGETTSIETTEEFPTDQKSEIASIIQEIDAEIDAIRLFCKPDYSLPFYPIKKFRDEMRNTLLKSSVPLETLDANRIIGSFQMIRPPNLRHARTVQCHVCRDRLVAANLFRTNG
jgi:hypothetical protein